MPKVVGFQIKISLNVFGLTILMLLPYFDYLTRILVLFLNIQPNKRGLVTFLVVLCVY